MGRITSRKPLMARWYKSLIRKFFGFIATVLVIALAGVFGYVGFTNWLTPKPIEITTDDGRPYASATQPVTPAWVGLLDNTGYDISFPQCAVGWPDTQVGFGIVGLNYGKPFTSNPCFGSQWKWATQHDGAAIYINVADTGKGSATKYGKRIAKDTIKRMNKAGVSAGTPVWLDIETTNTWSTPDRAMQVINETMAVLTAAGYPVGIYAAPVHWFEITLNAVSGVPIWLPIGKYTSTKAGYLAAKQDCKQVGFGDRVPAIVQFVTKKSGHLLDHNLLCGSPEGLLRQN